MDESIASSSQTMLPSRPTVMGHAHVRGGQPGQLTNCPDHVLSVLGVGIQNHDVILLFRLVMVLITLNLMEVKINLCRYHYNFSITVLYPKPSAHRQLSDDCCYPFIA